MKKVKFAFIPWDTSEESCKNRIAIYPRLKEINCEVVLNPIPLSSNNDYEGYGFKVKIEDVSKWCKYTEWGDSRSLTWWEIEEWESDNSEFMYIPQQRRVELD